MAPRDSFTLNDLFMREHLPSLLTAFALLVTAYIVEHFANIYAYTYTARPTSLPVGDFILDGITAVDLNFLIIEGALISIVLGVMLVLYRPRYVLFSLKALALFIVTRSIFISLTHVGISPEAISPGLGFFDSIYLYLNFQTGLFFSGHTGLPFLMALIFWHIPRIRYALLTLSVVFGIAVLFAHVHYSIDVFAAPFIAYGIFKIALRLFPKDYELITR